MRLSMETFFADKNAPLYQAGAMLVVILIANLLGELIELIGITEWDELSPWVISGSLLLGYALVNIMIGLASKVKATVYYGKSVIGYLGLAAGAAMIAKLFSSVALGEAGSMWWIYVVITISYLIFMGMMLAMKTIVSFAQNEDENFRQNKDKK